MRRRAKNLMALLLAVCLAAAVGCSGQEEQKTEISLGLLKGPTGIGATYLMEAAREGTAAQDYEITLAAEPNELALALSSGTLDIAALPTNVAVSLYNKTEGGVKLLALNTLGVLYILEKGESVQSVADLEGRTIYATGQGANPEYTLNYLLRENGLEPGEDVTVEFLAADELATRMGAGELELCMLPVPNATAVLMKNSDVRKALDLNQLWEELDNGSTLTMGCVVVRTEFLEENEAAVQRFLEEYEDSVTRVLAKEDDALYDLVEEFELTASAAVAKAALDDCNLTFIAGEAMVDAIEGYYEVLFEADPASIGGALPDEEFYYTNYSGA